MAGNAGLHEPARRMTVNATIRKLAEQGITSTTHHATIKSSFKAIEGRLPTKDEVEAIRALVDEVETEKAAPKMTPAEAMKRAKEIVKERAEDEDMEGWTNVRRVVQAGPDGLPVRVEIECQDPQERGGESVCVGKREIAAQDVFQVTRCEPCQKRVNVIARNESAKRRRAEANKATGKKAKKSA